METKHIKEWFDRGEWRHGFDVMPDDSIDRKNMYEHYHRYPDRWEIVFNFLKKEELLTMPLGRYDLSDDVYIMVKEYYTEEEINGTFEAHRTHIDLQYVVSGEEYIAITPLSHTTEISKYEKGGDYIDLNANDYKLHKADCHHFFIFFPEDAHRPNLRYENISSVRKIIAKVTY